VIAGWDPRALALGFGFAIAIIAGGFVLSLAALRERMART
jgi:hypothetical protein